MEVIGDDGDVDGQLMTVVIGTGGDDVHAVDALANLSFSCTLCLYFRIFLDFDLQLQDLLA